MPFACPESAGRALTDTNTAVAAPEQEKDEQGRTGRYRSSTRERRSLILRTTATAAVTVREPRLSLMLCSSSEATSSDASDTESRARVVVFVADGAAARVTGVVRRLRADVADA